jgi:hypothetical protein
MANNAFRRLGLYGNVLVVVMMIHTPRDIAMTTLFQSVRRTNMNKSTTGKITPN